MRCMSTAEPRPPAAAPGAQTPEKRRNPWIWISVVLVLACVGLVVWNMSIQSDLDSTQEDVEELQTQVTQAQDTGGTLMAGLQGAYDQFAQQLGATKDDLAAAKQGIGDAKESVTQAEADAATAAQEAADATDAVDEAEAKADEATAQAQAATSKAGIAADCAKAYVAAFGLLFDGDSVRAQVSVVGQELSSISADCKAALAGA